MKTQPTTIEPKIKFSQYKKGKWKGRTPGSAMEFPFEATPDQILKMFGRNPPIGKWIEPKPLL